MTRSPSVVSMTGFARTEGRCESASWTVEVKSVNGRTLDIRSRLPAGFDSLEIAARTEAARRFKRGSVTVTITLAQGSTAGRLRINRALLDDVLALARELEGAGAAPPRLDALLSVRGVIEPVEEGDILDRTRLDSALTAGIAHAFERLAEARAAEGMQLGTILSGQLDEIVTLVESATTCAATQPAILYARFRNQVTALVESMPALSEERMAQELALLVARGDIREELDRLRAHINAARALLTAGDAVGRRLDFLCQEFNREANTLCSKSSDIELTRLGLALKAAIEQMREQVQNIE
ncbi:MAG: YicC/YloC family endoribonuclease [Rhodospirillaceae bacterium]